jgi:hypothetical protein
VKGQRNPFLFRIKPSEMKKADISDSMEPSVVVSLLGTSIPSAQKKVGLSH